MNKLNVQAIFDGIDGEENGFLGAGQLTTFIRLKGCNLRCGYCDTKYSQEAEPENWMTIDEVIEQIHFPKITITGGEPLLQKGAVGKLCSKLANINLHNRLCLISVETNGTIQPSEHLYFQDCIRYIVDFKLPSSGVMDKMNSLAFSSLRQCDVIKFVISDEEDYKYARMLIVEHSNWQAKKVFSPAMKIDWKAGIGFSEYPVANVKWAQQLAEMMIRDRVDAQFSLQIHKILWPASKEER